MLSFEEDGVVPENTLVDVLPEQVMIEQPSNFKVKTRYWFLCTMFPKGFFRNENNEVCGSTKRQVQACIIKKLNVVNEQNGNYLVQFTPGSAGTCELWVSVDGIVVR